MPPAGTPPARGTPVQRRSVRIKGSNTSRTATVSLAVAAGAAIALLGIMRYWRSEDVVLPPQRTFVEWETWWKCDAGHRFYAAGHETPRQCWTCKRSAYPVALYECSVHGTYDVLARVEQRQEGKLEVTYLKLPFGDWVPVGTDLVCPRCKRRLIFSPENLLEGLLEESGDQ